MHFLLSQLVATTCGADKNRKRKERHILIFFFFNIQLLAEATKQIFGSLNREKDILTIEDEGFDVNATSTSEKNFASDGNIPEWAKLLEPVRKLPTNVGTRIRKCVNEALVKDPPDWARKILEHSISKEVYKGNASGPTKVLLIVTQCVVVTILSLVYLSFAFYHS